MTEFGDGTEYEGDPGLPPEIEAEPPVDPVVYEDPAVDEVAPVPPAPGTSDVGDGPDSPPPAPPADAGGDPGGIVAPGQPGFGEGPDGPPPSPPTLPPEDAGSDAGDVIAPGQPGFGDGPDGPPLAPPTLPPEDAGSDAGDVIAPGQPGFEDGPGGPPPVPSIDPGADIGDITGDDQTVIVGDVNVSVPGIAAGCHYGLPPAWQPWTPPAPPSEGSFTDSGYSTEWGEVGTVEGTPPEAVGAETLPEETVVSAEEVAGTEWAPDENAQASSLSEVQALLSQLYGEEVDAQEIADRAEANGWYVDEAGNTGVAPGDVAELLASYGVPSYSFDGSMGDPWQALNDAIANGQNVFVTIDMSTNIDLSTTNVAPDPGAVAGTAPGVEAPPEPVDPNAVVGEVAPGQPLALPTAMVIDGVDYSNGVVALSDPAGDAATQVPLQTVFDSWQQGNFGMTVADPTLEPPEGFAPPAGLEAPNKDESGLWGIINAALRSVGVVD